MSVFLWGSILGPPLFPFQALCVTNSINLQSLSWHPCPGHSYISSQFTSATLWTRLPNCLMNSLLGISLALQCITFRNEVTALLCSLSFPSVALESTQGVHIVNPRISPTLLSHPTKDKVLSKCLPNITLISFISISTTTLSHCYLWQFCLNSTLTSLLTTYSYPVHFPST